MPKMGDFAGNSGASALASSESSLSTPIANLLLTSPLLGEEEAIEEEEEPEAMEEEEDVESTEETTTLTNDELNEPMKETEQETLSEEDSPKDNPEVDKKKTVESDGQLLDNSNTLEQDDSENDLELGKPLENLILMENAKGEEEAAAVENGIDAELEEETQDANEQVKKDTDEVQEDGDEGEKEDEPTEEETQEEMEEEDDAKINISIEGGEDNDDEDEELEQEEDAAENGSNKENADDEGAEPRVEEESALELEENAEGNDKEAEEEEEENTVDKEANAEIEDEEESEAELEEDAEENIQEAELEEELEDAKENGADEEEQEVDINSSTEGQGTEINESTTKKNWEGFDEDMTSPKIDIAEQKTEEYDIGHVSDNSHNVSEWIDAQGYEGDGFRFHIFHSKGKGKPTMMQSHPIGTGAVALLASFLLCYCCERWRKRRSIHSTPHRGKYSSLGSDDFNGTFSDDISFHDKNSDDEMSMGEYYDSDEENGAGINMELGGFHEVDANGGLTLDECNG